MKTHATFVPVAQPSELQALRDEYLDQLELGQEASLEVLMPDSVHLAIEVEGERCGYFVVHERETLIEFYVTKPHWVYAQCICEQILAETEVKRARIKTYDHLLFSSVVAKQVSTRMVGILARERIPRALPPAADFQFTTRVATLDDMPAIMAIDQQVFRHPERLHMVVQAGFMFLFENSAGLLGFGIARPIVRGRKHVELGIAVDKPYRSQGHSMHVFGSMVEACEARGLVPVAGLSPDNIASRSMGERVGMIGRHRLLELSFV